MSTAALKIKIFDTKGTHLVPMVKSTATVGSAKHCDVVLEHASVNAEHVRAWCEGGRIWVQDLGSNAGTTLNGIRLPPLKPMLVRELDILKLGECPATMGLEPNLVRAPMVKPKPVVEESTATNIKPLVPLVSAPEKNTGDSERLSRELADLKLQLQMARLEKGSAEDLRRELTTSKEEISRLMAEKQKLKDSFSHVEVDKKNFKKQLENEVAELKLKALRELKDQREEDARRFDNWKTDAVSYLATDLRTLSDQKVKIWNMRPLSKDMIFEWESDLNALIRRLLLNEKKREEVPPIPKSNTQVTHTGLKPNISLDEATVIRSSTSLTSSSSSSSSRVGSKRKSRRSTNEGPWQKIAIGAFVLALVMAAAWFASSYYWKKEGARSMASQIETMPPTTPAQKTAKPPVDLKQTKGFKKTYTDNVMYTLNYVDAELNAEFRATWLKDLNQTARAEWKLDEKTISAIAAKEYGLLQELNRMKSQQALSQMRQREVEFMRDLQSRLGAKVTSEKFMRLKRTFFTRNQVYLSRESR